MMSSELVRAEGVSLISSMRTGGTGSSHTVCQMPVVQ